MNQTEFEAKYRQDWLQLREWLATHSDTAGGWQWWLPGTLKRNARSTDADASLFPERYRLLCQQVALARSRNYSLMLIEELNELAVKAHQRLYGVQKGASVQDNLAFAVVAFPVALWRNRGYVLLAFLVFFIPLFVMFGVCWMTETGVYSFLSYDTVSGYEQMYATRDPSAGLDGDSGRTADSDVYMFGFYIYNNIGVSFRTFAGGLLFGVGALFFLAFNGLSIGAVAGHLTRVGLSEPFFSFVAGHSAFELMAIVFSGAAGFKLGDAFFKPGQFTRLEALRRSAREGIILMYGAGLMLVVAAALEAFWSSSSQLPVLLKYGVGIFLWFLVLLYSISGYWLVRSDSTIAKVRAPAAP